MFYVFNWVMWHIISYYIDFIVFVIPSSRREFPLDSVSCFGIHKKGGFGTPPYTFVAIAVLVRERGYNCKWLYFIKNPTHIPLETA